MHRLAGSVLRLGRTVVTYRSCLRLTAAAWAATALLLGTGTAGSDHENGRHFDVSLRGAGGCWATRNVHEFGQRGESWGLWLCGGEDRADVVRAAGGGVGGGGSVREGAYCVAGGGEFGHATVDVVQVLVDEAGDV